MNISSSQEAQLSRMLECFSKEKEAQAELLEDQALKKANSIALLLEQFGGKLIANYDFAGLNKLADDSIKDPSVSYVIFYDVDNKPITNQQQNADGLKIIKKEIKLDGEKIGGVDVAINFLHIDTIKEKAAKRVKEKIQLIQSEHKEIINKLIVNIIIISCIALVILCIIFYRFITSLLINPIKKITKNTKNISTNLLMSAKSFGEMSANLASYSSEQATAVTQTASSLELLNKIIENNASQLETSNELSNDIVNLSTQGAKAMSDLTSSMDSIVKSTDDIEHVINIINEIKDKTSIIDEIVFQTKLLSFNASVEAERAGEHGRGFAVVAQEVGTLAEMSGKAALEISDMVKRSLANTETITKNNKEKVEHGHDLLKEAATILDEITQNSIKNKDNFQAVIRNIQEQNSKTKEIDSSVSKIDSMTKHNATLANDTEETSGHLTAEASKLDNTVQNLSVIILGKKNV